MKPGDFMRLFANQSLMKVTLLPALIPNATRVLCTKRSDYVQPAKETSFDLTRIRNRNAIRCVAWGLSFSITAFQITLFTLWVCCLCFVFFSVAESQCATVNTDVNANNNHLTLRIDPDSKLVQHQCQDNDCLFHFWLCTNLKFNPLALAPIRINRKFMFDKMHRIREFRTHVIWNCNFRFVSSWKTAAVAGKFSL